jgi:hypothetical protein
MKDDMVTEKLTMDLVDFVIRHAIIQLETDGFRKLQRAYDHLRDMNLGEGFIEMIRGEEGFRVIEPKYFEFRPMCYLVGVTDCQDSAVVENRDSEDLFKMNRIWLPYRESEFALLEEDDMPVGIYLGTEAPETRYRRIERVFLSVKYGCSCRDRIGE